MKFVEGPSELRWLPSRHHFGLFRLAAFLRLAAALRRGPGAPRRDLLFFVDRHQSAFEMYSVAIWVTVTATLYAGWCMAIVLPLPATILFALPVAALALELPMHLVSAVLLPLWTALTGRRHEINYGTNSRVSMAVLLLLSAGFTTVPSWVRLVAWLFLGLFALNAAAAAVAFLLRARIDRLESRAGGVPSAG